MKESKWIYVRNGEVMKVFKNRKEAVRYLKDMLKQTLSDFEKQDKTDEYTYKFEIPVQSIRPVEEREAYLGL